MSNMTTAVPSTPPRAALPSTMRASQTPQAHPPQDRSHKGALVVTVLSAYDLPVDEQPLSVSLEVARATVRSGPPSARHKDRNSFRFVQNQVLRVNAPLSTLYKEKAVLTVEYANPQHNLTAILDCQSAHIHETSWLILNLQGKNVENDDILPTLRLQVRLEGPYRTEIAALVSLANMWFSTVDAVGDQANSLTKALPNLPSAKLLLIPTVPLVTAAVVLSPILIGALIVGMPVFLPALVVVASAASVVAAVGGFLCASTKSGRKAIGGMVSPMYHTLLSTPSGQRCVYETGPRPTPVSMARMVLPQDLVGKLVVSLVIDAIGSGSYLLPVVGEALDIAWAPLQTILIMAMYNNVAPNLKYVSFVEELLPFTDVVPSATIGWVTEFGPQLMGNAAPKLNAGNERQVASLASNGGSSNLARSGGMGNPVFS